MTDKTTIKCPSCETTFAVASSALEGKAEERFHCSRCDSLFTFDLTSIRTDAEQTSPPVEPMISDTPPVEAQVEAGLMNEPTLNDIDDLISSIPAHVKPLQEIAEPTPGAADSTPASGNAGATSIDEFLGSPAEPEAVEATPEPFVPQPVLSQQAADTGVDEVPGDEIFRPATERPGADSDLFQGAIDGPDFQPSVAHGKPSTSQKLANTGEDLTSAPPSAVGTLAKGPVQTGMAFGEQPSEVSELTSSVTERPKQKPSAVVEDTLEHLSAAKTTEIPPDTADRFREQAKKAKPTKKNEKEPTPATNVTMGPVQEELPGTRDKELSATATAELFEQFTPGSHQPEMPPRIVVGIKSIAYISAPILLFLIILGGANYYLQSNTSISDRLVSLFQSQPQIAPAGLLVENTAFEPVVLPTGEKVFLISGKIANRTSDTVHNVVVEGVAFDQDGAPVSAVRTAATSNIERSELSLMSLDNIKKLQQVRGSKPVAIPAGGEKKFTIALVEGEELNPQFYTARIFSVSL